LSKKLRISARLLFLASLNALSCSFLYGLLHRAAGYPLDWGWTLLFFFGSFIVALSLLYYFYYIDITGIVNTLSEKIKRRFSSKEIPQKYSQLEDEDGLARLEERVDFLIETREREISHFENLDSYRKEYLGNVSHELKTPVFNIQGYIDTLLNGGLEDSSINVDYLRRAEAGIDRLITIIDDLETITQLESGALVLDLDSFDLAALCRDVYAGLEMAAAKKNITLSMARKYEKPVMVIADKFRIRQVLANLVGNSVKYGKQNGNTVISLTYLNDDVIVEVGDDGAGIDEKHLPRIFERFYRIDKGRSREQGGTGLGLAIVKHIIEAHDKSIKVESAPGKGTRFIFSLRAAP
jgi:two-component system, OmpR family, phosphate regulon sensor histidine kinase PhoR